MKKHIRVWRRRIKAVFGMDLFYSIDYCCRKSRFGSEYGGWVCAEELLNTDSIVYSFGVGRDISFDKELISKCNLTVHAFDPTPKSITWLRKQILPPNFFFHEYGVADFNGYVFFNPPVNNSHVSHTILPRPETEKSGFKVFVKKISTIKKELGHGKIDILKMDIEGAEYSVIKSLRRSQIRPLQILVEFHHGLPSISIEMTRQAIVELKEMGYKLFSVSDNGCELSFIHDKAISKINISQ